MLKEFRLHSVSIKKNEGGSKQKQFCCDLKNSEQGFDHQKPKNDIHKSEHFAERKFVCSQSSVWAQCLCFLFQSMFMVDMTRCGKPQMKE